MSPVSKLFLPPTELAGCVHSAIYRDTRGAALSKDDRLNYFPASPLVSMTVVTCGELQYLASNDEAGGVEKISSMPRLFVMGPRSKPLVSRAAGEVVATTLGIYPDAWLHLGGDQEFSQAPERLVAAFDCLTTKERPEEGWQSFCGALGPTWTNSRPTSWPGTNGIEDWARAIVARALTSGSGKSIRSLERRIKRLSGQTRRCLDFYSNIENLHRLALQKSDSSLADIAFDAGYADQSHMGRAVRRATGLSPARLNQAIREEEAFWCYRLLGERL
ncbi:HTH-type transcriptional activator RhaS [Rhodobiaceae bacterium]|nr:HTH-type transcriptional activator RhaS [Rhodobiaceae bacterium]